MTQNYQPQEIESKWQKIWQEQKLYQANDFSDKPKRYILIEFPYPSGDGLHVGHCLSYIAQDVVSRYYRMKGDNVLFPIGWDAFGLPAENYAIKHKVHPRQAVEKNISTFKRQIQSLGISFDWSREINTTDPAYYKWTQWIFLQLFKAGLAEKKMMPINWCPKDKIGLAFEEVVDGTCERCGTEVERRTINQWVLKITRYADKLIEGLESVDFLPHIKKQQLDWIGRSEGAEVKFEVTSSKQEGVRAAQLSTPDSQLLVFTTRPDTIFGATFLVLAPEHPLVESCKSQIENWDEVAAYLKASKKLSERERQEKKDKSGVELKGMKAIHPISQQQIPIFVADYVMTGYGTGAVMAVPAHDQRDWEFANTYNLPIVPVIAPTTATGDTEIYTGSGVLIHSGQFDGQTSDEAKQNIVTWLAEHGLAESKVNYKLRDWIFSRQHYWGEPIPVIHCDHCKEVVQSTPHRLNIRDERVWKKLLSGEKTVETRALNPEEPDRYFGQIKVDDLICCAFVPTGETLYFKIKEVRQYKDLSEFAADEDYVSLSGGRKNMSQSELEKSYAYTPQYAEKIKNNGLIAWRIKRIYPGIIPLRAEQLPLELPPVDHYEPTDTGESPLAAITDWVNVSCRVCGSPAKRETDTMPNWAGSSWYFLRYTDPHNSQMLADSQKTEYWLPVDLYNGGNEHTTLHLLYSRFWHRFLYDQGLVSTPEPYRRRVSHGMILGPDNQKMSKSRGNVINPDSIVEKFGADALRLYEMFMGEYDATKVWSEASLQGSYRFLKRVWNYCQNVQINDEPNKDLDIIIHASIKKITEDIERRSFNTVVSQLMIMFNAIEQQASVSRESLSIFLRLMAPLAPHMTEEIWHSRLGRDESIHSSEWPQYTQEIIDNRGVVLPVQINGKKRLDLEFPKLEITQDEEHVKRWILAQPSVQKYLHGATPKKVIYVPGKIVNIVI